ncbi:MAG: BspA family leucine-rich repeat surface protein [Saprospiraceae bacterium]
MTNLGLTGGVTHDYGTAGIYQVAIYEDFPRIYFNNGGDKEKLVSVDQWGDVIWQSMSGAFYGCTYLSIPATDAPDLSSVTDMSYVFSYAINFNDDINHWDVSMVNNMSVLFAHASAF